MTPFPPIAVVGHSCVLPGAFSAAELWEHVLSGNDLLTNVPEHYWNLDSAPLLSDATGRKAIATDRGGYVVDFEKVFDLNGFAVPPEEVEGLDPLFQWVLWGSRKALEMAGHDCGRNAPTAGLIIGNLGYPSSALTRYAECVWTGEHKRPRAENRFHFGLPSQFTAKALRLGNRGFSLDAACASSLYAIKLACDRLQDHEADLIVAGGVNRSDNLFLHAGFTTLNALSSSGRSLPFHRAADGLVPSEGAAFVVLKRLEDAVVAGDQIFCVIRGIGLSNDGRSSGLLVPSSEGQVRAMMAAYEMSGISPEEVSYVECHATGTPIGDDTEIRSMETVFVGNGQMTVGSLKSNLGHLITAAGSAGLIKVIEAMNVGLLPPMRNTQDPSPAMRSSRFHMLSEAVCWEGRKCAAVSAFGFGGNNAHLILEQWGGQRPKLVPIAAATGSAAVAMTGIGIVAADGSNTTDFLNALATYDCRVASTSDFQRAPATVVELSSQAARFPPKDLEDCDGHQLLLLKAAFEASQGENLADARVGVFVGMESNPEIARHCAAWRILDHVRTEQGEPSEGWIQKLFEVLPPLSRPSTVLGTMPNMPANRLSSHYNCKGPGFTIGAGEASGETALRTAVRALRAGEIDVAIVGAVDLSCEPVHETALRGTEKGQIPPSGDCAIVFVLRLAEYVVQAKQGIIALIEEAPSHAPALTFGSGPDSYKLNEVFGHAYAASGLLHLAAAALCCRYRLRPGTADRQWSYWIPDDDLCCADVHPSSGPTIQLVNEPRVAAPGILFEGQPSIHCYSGANRTEVLAALRARRESAMGQARLAIVSSGEREFESRVQQAENLLLKDAPILNATLANGIFYADRPVGGQLAFVFTGAGAAYPGMGKELLVAFPELWAHLGNWSSHLKRRAEWIYEETNLDGIRTEQYLHGASFLCQLHSKLTLDVLKLRPDAVLGLSSGESNALFALDAWKDGDAMFSDISASSMYDRELAGRFDAVKRFWNIPSDQTVSWCTLRITAPVTDIRTVLADEPFARLLIIHTECDCLIGGDVAACERVLKRLGSPPSQATTHNMAIHCPEVMAFQDQWRRIHCRPTAEVPGVRFYANAIGDSYTPTQERAAEMLLKQAVETVDLPRTVRKAWEDGVRVFVEHGPRNLCSEWIGKILNDRPHISVALDRFGRSSVLQCIYAVAQLTVAGADINAEHLLAPLRRAINGQIKRPEHRDMTFPVHPPAIVIPPFEPKCSMDGLPDEDDMPVQSMPPAPPLPLSDIEPVFTIPSPVFEVPMTVPSAAAVTVSPAVMAARAMGDAHRAALKQHVEILRLTLDARLAAFRPSSVQIQTPPLPANDLEIVHPTRPTPVSLRPPTPIVHANGTSKGPTEPQFTREQVLIHASGNISDIFGPMFRQQDAYKRQVRMPDEPMLLVDRVTGISGEPGQMGLGTIWTETDIRELSWYLHERRILPGLLIEAGQADLMLISWLGADLNNRDERVYRLLGCDLTYHGELPQVGDTLRYEIHIDGHAQQGPVRLFFFHYDCLANDRLCLTVRNGQAGFFTDQELMQSAGVLWNPEAAQGKPGANVARPEINPASSYTPEQIRLFAAGRTLECFGEGYEFAGPHKLSPRIPSGRLQLFDEVTSLSANGGPWGRGYMRAVRRIAPGDWFFKGHFKNDPCMPGTLMAEGCQQVLAFYLAALGFTVERDAWRFEPAVEEVCRLRCRGQVTPLSQELVYEVFVEELNGDATPTVYADVLVTVDGLKALHAQRMGARLVPDWPLEGRYELPREELVDLRPAGHLGGFHYNRRTTLESALGKPSKAFGPQFRSYDGPFRMARLPAPPFNFVSRLSRVETNTPESLIIIETEYDLRDETSWFYRENGAPVMPISILMEVTIQPCGWSSVYAIKDEPHEQDRFFRNLDGTATLHAPIEGNGVLRSRVKLRSVSRSSGIILTSFDVEAHLDGKLVYTLKTGCGFFLKQTLASQAGIPPTEAELCEYRRPGNISIDLSTRPERYFRKSARLPDSKLLMIDRIVGFWPEGGSAGLGRVRAEKDVKPDEWFLKAHFFQDPVQPGSLGVEGMNQTLQFFMLHLGLDEAIPEAEFQAFALGEEVTWKYRGQVLPSSRKVEIEIEILEIRKEADSVLVRSDGWLWVDGTRIYQAKNIAARLHSPRRKRNTVTVNGTKTMIAEPGHTLLRPDAGTLKAYWNRCSPGASEEAVEELITRYCCKFVRRVSAVSPSSIEGLKGAPVLFVANHQTISESILFPFVIPLVTASHVTALGKWRVKGDVLVQSVFRILHGRLDEPILYVDQSDPRSMIEIAGQFRRLISERGRSVLIHVQGVRTMSCREPARTVSGIVAELAIAAGIPVVPVRFWGGLPVEPADHKLDFPVHYGAQDYVLGEPISPQTLASMNLMERKRAILDGINNIRPLAEEEEPIRADGEFEARVLERMAAKAMSEWEAVLLECLNAPAHLRLTQIFPVLS